MTNTLPTSTGLYAGYPYVPEQPPVAGLVRTGLGAALLLLVGFGGWATLAPLASAAIAPGVVKVDTNHKTIQHLEGGIVRQILVRDGSTVRRGQILVRLDSLDAEADRDAAQLQIDALSVQEARLIAQRDGRENITFPEVLLARRSDPKVADILTGQQRIFLDQKKAIEDQVGVWKRRIEQYRAQIATFEAQNAAIAVQLPLLQEELTDSKALYMKGLGLKPKVLALERQIAASKGDIAANEGRILSSKQQIAEGNVQIAGVLSTQAKSISEELRTVQGKLSDSREQMRKLEARAGRTEVVAPQDGTVMNMRIFTVGGVVAPGGPILDLVPLQDRLIFEVRVQPLDIDVVRPQLPATVRLVAYKQRTTPALDGIVTRIAADASTDEKSGASYFVATVEVNSEQLARVPHVKLYPGMPVDVSIVTGQRTLFAYLLQPLTDSFAHALRED